MKLAIKKNYNIFYSLEYLDYFVVKIEKEKQLEIEYIILYHICRSIDTLKYTLFSFYSLLIEINSRLNHSIYIHVFVVVFVLVSIFCDYSLLLKIYKYI